MTGDGRSSLRGKGFVPPPPMAQPADRPRLDYARESTGRRPWLTRKWTAFRDEWGSIRQLLGVIFLVVLYIAYRVARVWMIYWFLSR